MVLNPALPRVPRVRRSSCSAVVAAAPSSRTARALRALRARISPLALLLMRLPDSARGPCQPAGVVAPLVLSRGRGAAAKRPSGGGADPRQVLREGQATGGVPLYVRVASADDPRVASADEECPRCLAYSGDTGKLRGRPESRRHYRARLARPLLCEELARIGLHAAKLEPPHLARMCAVGVSVGSETRRRWAACFGMSA